MRTPKNNFIFNKNKVLKISNDYNPIFIHFVSSGYTYNLYTKIHERIWTIIEKIEATTHGDSCLYPFYGIYSN